jgi:fatty-acyl-CoA synthase/feruloyl-CoA synthase
MPTIGGIVIQNAARVPGRAALVMGERRWTWAELDRDVALAAGRLRTLGLRHGDRLAIIAANIPENVIAYLATLRLGAVVVPVNARLAVPEIAYILDDATPVVIASAPEFDQTVDAAIAQSTLSAARVTLGPAGSYPDLVAPHGIDDAVTEDHAREDDDALIMYTSGTTGKPKGVLLDHHRAVWAALAQVVSLGLRDGEVYLHLPPLYHSGGVVFLDAITILGGTNVLIPAFEPEAVFSTIERERITALLGVPTMYEFLLQAPGLDSFDLSSWRTGVFGAAPMSARTIGQLLERLPGVDFYQQCGQTEAGPTGIYSTFDQVRERPDSSGHLAQPFLVARVVDEVGEDVSPGSVGELVFRGDGVMKGYWNNPEGTAEAMRDGWLHTGDLVELHDDGAMRLVDRLKDIIITGGRNVYSAEVEKALGGHPDLADFAVIGKPHPEWGETVIVVVTPKDGSEPTIESIREYLRPLIADYKLPREMRIGDIPRTASGKLQKHLLRSTL